MSYASKRRKEPPKDEGGGANWMDTYGDLVTLLLCFFVLLFAFSSVDAAKWEALVGAFSGVPQISIHSMDMATVVERPIEVISTTLQDPDAETTSDMQGGNSEEIREAEYKAFFTLYESVMAFISEHGLNASVFPDFDTYILIMRFDDSVFFESGDATILSDATEVLDQTIRLLEEHAELYKMIRIEGHTDNRQIHTAKYPSNWELSMFRAGNTLHYILDSGKIDVTKISATGYGEYHPIDTNDTAEGRAANRRVDFVIEGIKTA